jgi:hypothetical protein
MFRDFASVLEEPFAGQFGHLLQRSRFLKEMSRPGHNGKMLLTAQLPVSLTIKSEDSGIVATHDQQCWGLHTAEDITSQVGTTAA